MWWGAEGSDERVRAAGFAVASVACGVAGGYALLVSSVEHWSDRPAPARAVVVRWVDAGTLIVTPHRVVRLVQVSAPTGHECGAGRALGFVRALFPAGSVVTMERDVRAGVRDGSGRALAYVRARGIEETAQDALLSAGLARRDAPNGARGRLASRFAREESLSRTVGIGSWRVCAWGSR